MKSAAELLLASLLGIGLVQVAQAQVGNPSGLAPGTQETAPGVPASGETNQVDRLFLEQFAMANRAEIETGELAMRKAQNDAIRKFARRMTHDHSQADNGLAELAKARNITLPDTPDAEQQMMQERLRKLSGADLDALYAEGQVTSHQKAATLLEWEIGSGENNQVKQFASQTLPVVFQHLQMALTIQRQLAAAGRPDPPRQESP
jgi:putative membrane protein